ncbi:universal stress protein [Mycobacterium sp. SMC-8]|uniref:universal stress protein n=1 Tax=Mycobacterium sp. SMC-8 TaxID=2857060 RepID=UPI0021B3634A|nr:universal stress protein [Mycobacterium sp. SMC-8]UXA14701.1 universal stress protein [Mycobacterium sp. SMC-8]
MTTANSSMPVVAGVDGSAAALGAALWAVHEAAARGTALRLVYVTKPVHRNAAEYACEYAEDVRRGRESLREAKGIIVAVNDRPHNGVVIEQALQEAALRHAPVLVLGDSEAAASTDALEQRIRPWHQRYPQVHVYPITDRADVAHFLKKHDEPVLLAVIGDDEAHEVAQIVGHGRSALRHGASSALVVRS